MEQQQQVIKIGLVELNAVLAIVSSLPYAQVSKAIEAVQRSVEALNENVQQGA